MSGADEAPAGNSAEVSDARQRLVARFLTAVRDNQIARAETMLDAEPMLVHDSILIAAAVGVTIDAQVDAVRALLDAGASANASVLLPDVSDRIPVLCFPCVTNAVAVARLLLERGANPTDGESVYHAAQHDHRECLMLLQEFGADLSRGPAHFGNTPLHFLAAHRATNTLSPKVVRGMQWLLEHGADPNVTSYGNHDGRPQARTGETPLHWRAWNGHVAMVKLLLAHGAPVNFRDMRYGSSPVGWVSHGSQHCDRGNDEDYPAIVHLLLDAGATRAESFNQWNESPESMARPSVVLALKERGFTD